MHRGSPPWRGPVHCYLPPLVARLYDLMLMLDPNAPEERQSEVLSNVGSMIEASGTLIGRHDWGVRRMSFEIDHRPEAAYHLIQFETDSSDLLQQLEHSLKIADGVLRFRIIRLKPGSPPPPTPRTEAPRTRERPQDTRVAPRAAADSQRPEGEGEGEPPAPAEPAAADPEPSPESSEQAPA
ncbi:MAG: small subunit ribosomal protein [Thermoleophilaceae bacterium]|nr:small subunit ribosomal protein [Thermoleophilaceae bacterium]